MRTLILIVACIGIGYGIANSQFRSRTTDIKNIMGSELDMAGAIEKAKATVTKPGKIEVIGGTEFDFGTMSRGTKRQYSFVFKNIGEAPVELVNKGSTCKCTVGTLNAKKLEPGEETPVELEWLAEGLMADFAQTATIGTSAFDQEEIKLTVKGKIGQAFVFDPASADFRDFLSGDENEFTGRLYSFDESPLDISSVSWSDASLSSKITGEFEEAIRLKKGEIPQFADARSYIDFKIHLKKGIPAGVLSGNMVFNKKSDKEDGKDEAINFPINGRSVAPIRVIAGPDYNEEKNIFDLRTAKSEVGLKKSFVIAIKNDEAKNIEIKLGKVSPAKAEGALKVTITELKVSPKQKMFSVTLEIAPGTPPVEFAGAYGKDFAKIVLETNMESAPQFPMFIKFRISE